MFLKQNKKRFPSYYLFATTLFEFLNSFNEFQIRYMNTGNLFNQILSQQIIKKKYIQQHSYTKNRENVPRDFACYFY